MQILRWILTIALAPLGYVAAVLMAMALSQWLTHVCPPDLLVSGACTAEWYPRAETTAFAVATATGAVLWVVLPTLVAPTQRKRVAWVAYACGVAFASWFVIMAGGWLIAPCVAAVVVGAMSAWLVTVSPGVNRRDT